MYTKKISLILCFSFFSTLLFSEDQQIKRWHSDTPKTVTLVCTLVRHDDDSDSESESEIEPMLYTLRTIDGRVYGTLDLPEALNISQEDNPPLAYAKYENFWKSCLIKYSEFIKKGDICPPLETTMISELYDLIFEFNLKTTKLEKVSHEPSLDATSNRVLDFLYFYHGDTIFKRFIFKENSPEYNFIKQELHNLREKFSADVQNQEVNDFFRLRS